MSRAALSSLTIGILAASSCTLLVGCSSLSSTFVKDPQNGDTITGMPIVVERPRFLRVTEIEVKSQLVLETATRSMPANRGGDGVMASSPVSASSMMTTSGPVESHTIVEFETVTVGEVYAVDFKRPGAGTAEFTFEFADGSQYPSKVSGETEDKTIETFATAIGTIAEKVVGLNPTSGQTVLPSGAERVEVSRDVVRVTLFDLDRLGTNGYEGFELFNSAQN